MRICYLYLPISFAYEVYQQISKENYDGMYEYLDYKTNVEIYLAFASDLIDTIEEVYSEIFKINTDYFLSLGKKSDVIECFYKFDYKIIFKNLELKKFKIQNKKAYLLKPSEFNCERQKFLTVIIFELVKDFDTFFTFLIKSI